MPGEEIIIPPGDLTTAAIEAVNLILSYFGFSPLDLILGLFSGKPKFEDTNNVIAAYKQSAYWPLHALAADLQIAANNGAPISDSNPAVQKQFGVWKQGTVTSIQTVAGVTAGPTGPGYWTIFALIQKSWAASGFGIPAVLQYVKAIDAVTIVLSQSVHTGPTPAEIHAARWFAISQLYTASPDDPFIAGIRSLIYNNNDAELNSRPTVSGTIYNQAREQILEQLIAQGDADAWIRTLLQDARQGTWPNPIPPRPQPPPIPVPIGGGGGGGGGGGTGGGGGGGTGGGGVGTGCQPPIGDARNDDELAQWLRYLGCELEALSNQVGSTGGGTPSDCCAQIVVALGTVGTALTAIATAVANLSPSSGPPPAIDLSAIVAALGDLVTQVTAIANAPGADVGPVVTAINSTRDVLSNLEKCVCDALAKGIGTDVSGIVDQLKQANVMNDVPQPIIDELAKIGILSPELAQLAGGGAFQKVSAAARDAWRALKHGADVYEEHAARVDPVWGKVVGAVMDKNPLPPFKEILGMLPGAYGNLTMAALEEVFTGLFNGSGAIFNPIITAMLDVHNKEIGTLRNVNPGDEEKPAAKLLSEAAAFGVAAHWASVGAEALYPSKQLGLTQIAGLLGTLGGFELLARGFLGPEIAATITVPHTYSVNARARSHLPTQGQAAEMYSRRKITPAQLQDLMGFAGLNKNWVDPITSIAYRPMSPMMLAAGFANADVDMAKLQDTLEYMGIRPEDLPLAEQAVITRSLQQTRQALVNEAVTAYGQGVVSDDELAQILTDAGYGKSASKLVMQRALIARRITLARESESYVVPEVTQGLLTPDEGLQALEGAGVQPWQAQLKITLAETRAALTQARKAAAAERKLELQRQRNLTRAAVAEYERGTLDDAGLTAALLALGLDATLIGTIVAVENAKRAGRLKLVFGQLLTPSAAKLLEDQVAALETQFKKQLIDETSLRAQLTALNVDAPELEALIARWAAARAAATKTGYVLPV